MKRDEIVTALRCCASFNGEFECSKDCPFFSTSDELGDCCTKNEKLAADRKALINELCQYCGRYKQAHEGACDGCKWREL